MAAPSQAPCPSFPSHNLPAAVPFLAQSWCVLGSICTGDLASHPRTPLSVSDPGAAQHLLLGICDVSDFRRQTRPLVPDPTCSLPISPGSQGTGHGHPVSSVPSWALYLLSLSMHPACILASAITCPEPSAVPAPVS